MPRFTWLHLTDLHVGMNAQDHLWPNIREAFFKDLGRMRERTGPWDAVFFTGDLVQRGATGEFDRLEALLKSMWGKFCELQSEPLLFVVPGNHDLSRPQPNASVRLLSKWNDNPEIHEEFWSDSSSEYRKVIEKEFANYTQWRTNSSFKLKNQSAGLLPGDYSSVVELGGFKVGVIGVNTAFLQLTEGNYEGKLAWDPRQFHCACDGDGSEWTKQNNFSILLSHHGIEWLNKQSQTRVSAEIAPAGRFAVHLFGHMHAARMLEESEGGGPVRRLWQGKSLFGLEHFGDEQQELRLHGYSIGTIQTVGNSTVIRRWPRSARFHEKNGWQMIPDYESFSLEDDGGTSPRTVDLALDVSKKIFLGGERPVLPSGQLQVAGIDDVLKWDWDGRQLLERLIELDLLTIPGVTLAHEGDPDQWGPVFMHNPETWRLLTTEPGNIVGYWHIAPLFPPEYNLARSGKLLDSQITAKTVQIFEEPGRYDIYFVQVCMRPQHRRPRQVRLLFETFFDVLDTLSADGIFVREICANAFTDVGASLCRSFNLEWICKHSEHGEIYAGQISAVLKHSLARRFPELQKRYAKEGLIEDGD